MKEIKDYLHLYLGCEVKCPKQSGWIYSQKIMTLDRHFWFQNFEKEFIPILRQLSDMTEKEHNKVAELLGYPKPYTQYKKDWFKWYWEGEGHEMFFAPAHITEVFKYLLSIGIDLFGLIEAGLAIQKSESK